MIDTLFLFFFFFFFNDTATTEIYTLSLHDALPIFVLEETRELSRLHAIDSRLVFLNDQVNARVRERLLHVRLVDRKSTRLNSSHDQISYAVFCLKKKKYLNKQHYSNLANSVCHPMS